MIDYNSFARYVSAIAARGVNICESYADWLAVGFSCASYGEQARGEFHALSRVSAKYKEQECDAQFAACLRSVKDSQNASAVLALAGQQGVKLTDILRKSSSTGSPSARVSRDLRISAEFLAAFPALAEVSVLASSPSLLLPVLWSFAVGASAVASGVRILYGGRVQPVHLYYCLCAPAASGKSVLSEVAKCFGSWHRARRERSVDEWTRYQEELKAASAADRQLIKEPPLYTGFLPSDTTTAALLATIRDNGGGGLMWESELDTILRSFKSELGSYSDVLRNNYHGEPIRSNRKTQRQIIELEDTHVACVVSGTPRQVGQFFRSSENGLLSRFAFGMLPPSLEWRSQWEGKDTTQVVASVGAAVASLGAWSERCPCRVGFSPSQKRQLDTEWASWQEVYYSMFGDVVLPIVRRLALMQVRLAAVLSLLQRGAQLCERVQASAEAWQLAAMMCEGAADDACAVLSLLPDEESREGRKARERSAVLAQLPQVFSVEQLPASLSTASKYRWCAVWEKEGLITKAGKQWQKTS